MKKQIFKIILIIIAFCFFNTAYASLNIETDVSMPANCTVTDTDGVAHNYPQADSSGSYLAICALDAAIKSGSVSGAQLSNQYPEYGLFVAAINGVAADPNSQYWAIYQNGNFANFGITSLPVVTGDTIMFQLHDFSENNLGDQVTLHIHLLNTSAPTGGGPLVTDYIPPAPATVSTTVPTPVTKPIFDSKRAFDFLITQQKSDGSFGEDLYTDWTTLALASNPEISRLNLDKISKYFSENKLSVNLLTDYERHVMALMALGLNPYNIYPASGGASGENYIGKIISHFDGRQFGNINQDNDDIFALIVLQNAGYTQNDKIISDNINFILSRQKEDGSWDENADMTGAAIEALSAFSPIPGIGESLKKAKEFLKQNQKDNGGWNNSASSTAWAMEGIFALNEQPEDWIKNGNTPLDYLAINQDTDGGIKDLPAGEEGENMQNKIWETAYVVSALSGKTWNQIMQKFEKPKELKGQSLKNSSRTVLKKPNIKNLAKQNVATAINAVTLSSPTVTKTETPQKSWFARFLDKIFSAF